ncbi:hypothetical protein [Pseudomonas sp. DWP3-1-2]|uniref:hypothetical protein n=1 Tax=Pseudomonas sp. DWP3-1-2 TaxID=2804645 RepID=UPI003CF7E989
MNARSLITALTITLTLLLAGCASAPRAPPAPPIVISPNTWEQVDREIIAASRDAASQAGLYARGSMDHWRLRVYEQTEAQFIPWFSSYWTQEWLAMKVGWYSMSAGDDQDASANRLADYLQEQYRGRVLAPVAVEIDPDAIMQQSTQFYVQLLAQQLQRTAQRHGVPVDQMNRHLNGVPAIALGPPPPRNASLYQLIHTEPLTALPAWLALQDKIHTARVKSSQAAIASVAKHTSDKLQAQFASRGAASAAAAAAGRVAGLFISIGVAGYRAVAHENDRQEMEDQLRQSLGPAFDGAWLGLMKNRDTGVMAGVYYLSGQIEANLAARGMPSAMLESLPSVRHNPPPNLRP